MAVNKYPVFAIKRVPDVEAGPYVWQDSRAALEITGRRQGCRGQLSQLWRLLGHMHLCVDSMGGEKVAMPEKRNPLIIFHS